MRESFEQQRKLSHDRYDAFSIDDRRQILYKSRKKNTLVCRQLKRLKHDLLRLGSERVQYELEGNQTQIETVETKILKKKGRFLKILTQNRR